MRRAEPRLPLEPLVQIFGSVSALAGALNRNRMQVSRWRSGGLPLSSADRIAVSLGWHPVEVWPEWYAVTGSEAEAA